MTRRNNLYLLISMLVLMTVLALLMLSQNSGDKIEVDKDLFKVADQTKIDRVLLKNDREEFELHYNGTKWMVNNSYEADRQMIQVFFATLLQAEPRRPVALRVRDSIHQQINKEGIEVKLYEGSSLVKDFRVLGNEHKTETYYEVAGDLTPYLVTIPGYRVYVAAIFGLSSMDWRDKRLFNFNWQNFKRLTATFTDDGRENFAISFQDKFFGMEGNPKADTTTLNDYLDAVSLVQATRYLTKGSFSLYDSILATTPYYSIEVTDIADRSYRLDLYPPGKNDADVLGRLGDGQAVLISRGDYIRLNRKKSHFSP